MDWTVMYYQYQASQWERRAEEAIIPGDIPAPDSADADPLRLPVEDWKMRGKICYAMKQKCMWDLMVEEAKAAFADSKRRVGLIT